MTIVEAQHDYQLADRLAAGLTDFTPQKLEAFLPEYGQFSQLPKLPLVWANPSYSPPTSENPCDKLVVFISGGSGSGKEEIINKAVGLGKGVCARIVSTTSRPIREDRDEVQGNPYHFVSKDEFETMVDENRLAEFVLQGKYYYGTSYHAVHDALTNAPIAISTVELTGWPEITERIAQAYPDTQQLKVFALLTGMSFNFYRNEWLRSKRPEDFERRAAKTAAELALAPNATDLLLENPYDQHLPAFKAALSLTKFFQQITCQDLTPVTA